MYQKFTLPLTSPSVMLDIAEYFADWHGTCLLYSGGSLDSAQYSLLALFPFESISIAGGNLRYQKEDYCENRIIENPWEELQEQFFGSSVEDPDSMAFGWLGYGLGACADGEQMLPYRSSSTPDAYWQRCSVVLTFDHKKNLAEVRVNRSTGGHPDNRTINWIEAFATFDGWQSFLKKLPPRNKTYLENSLPLPFTEDSERKTSYLNKVLQAQELIRAGEVYQVNLSQLFNFQSNRHPFSLFRQICETNPAPFSAYIRYENTSIVSSSPERFLSKNGLELESRPIKGTIQRGNTIDEDIILKERLLASPKERAELVMITDLMRNDLGKISIAGSVKTIELWRCEAYTNVFHLLSIIRSTVRKVLKPLEIIRACFPAGSITGCPKIRAMEVIDMLESRPRGIYTGSIGYITEKGDFDLNIAIRTLIIEEGSYSLQLGGGIVIDSILSKSTRRLFIRELLSSGYFKQREILCD